MAATLQKTWQSSAVAVYRNWLRYVVTKRQKWWHFRRWRWCLIRDAKAFSTAVEGRIHVSKEASSPVSMDQPGAASAYSPRRRGPLGRHGDSVYCRASTRDVSCGMDIDRLAYVALQEVSQKSRSHLPRRSLGLHRRQLPLALRQDETIDVISGEAFSSTKRAKSVDSVLATWRSFPRGPRVRGASRSISEKLESSRRMWAGRLGLL